MKKIIFASLIVLISMAGCTQNQRAKKWGGTANISLPKGEKLINITWKDSQMWYLTRPMTEKDSAETYSFREESGYGLIEGTVYIKESK